MATSLDLAKPRARDQGVPAKVLVVDDDELELSLMSDRLTAAGFDVTVAQDGARALEILQRQWFPVILTDWQMPVMDGIAFIEALRTNGGEDSYVIMLSVRNSAEDFERGYFAGVDDYLSKKSRDTEIQARVEAGLSTVALRRSLRQSRAALAMAQQQVESAGVDSKAQLTARLQTEIARARRYRRPCSVFMLGIHAANEATAELTPALHAELGHALQGVIRADIDVALCYEATPRHALYAIVLPETGPAEVAAIRRRVRASLEQRVREDGLADALQVSVGAASVDPTLEVNDLQAEQLLATAELCRRCMASCGARRLNAVQSSVTTKTAIPCRYGYAVADHCLELDHRYASETKSPHSASTERRAGGAAA